MPRKATSLSTKRKVKRWCLLSTEILLYLVGIGLLIQVFFVRDTLTNEFDTEAAKKLIISPSQQIQNTTTYQNWISNECKDLCSIQLFNYYVFNITNPDDLYDGGYPQLQELGPFVFNRYEYRRNVNFSEDGSIVSYTYEYKYVLNEERTNMSLWNKTTWYNYQLHNTLSPTHEPTKEPTINDEDADDDDLEDTIMGTRNPDEIPPYPPIYILNPFMLGAFARCYPEGAGGTISQCRLLTNRDNLYLSDNTIEEILQKGLEAKTRFCGLANLCNVTQKYIVDDNVTVSEYTGINGNVDRMRELITFYNESQTDVDYWRESVEIEGTREPKQFPFNQITKNSVLKVWAMDKYRHVNVISNGSIYVNNLKLDKFVIDPKEYLSAENNSNNSIYYQDGGLHDGLLNLTTTNGANILQYSSKPYFLDAPYYINESKKMGLPEPNRSAHDTFFAIDIGLGTIFKLRVAYQVSFGIKPCPNCGSGLIANGPFSNLPDIIIPQFYVILNAGAPNEAIDQYEQILLLLDTTTQYSIYVGPAVALCCFVIAFYLTGRRYCKYRRRHNMTLYFDDDSKMEKHEIKEPQPPSPKQQKPAPIVENSDSEEDDSWSDSIGYAKRDEDNPMMELSIDHTLTKSKNNKSKTNVKTKLLNTFSSTNKLYTSS